MPCIDASSLTRFAAELFARTGASERDALIVARHLVEANLAGHDSHGILRVAQYLAEIDAGHIVPSQVTRTLDDWPAGAVIDARGAFGQVACHDAMQLAIQKAKAATTAVVTLRHANHSGRLGAYAEMAAAAGVIGLIVANAGGGGQWVAPFGGRERRLSTNPLAFGAPSGGEFPILLDMSTSIVPEGKVRDHKLRARALPAGWLVDASGQPSSDPEELYRQPGGALLPLGGPAGHKGFGLAILVDILAGALSGAGCPRAETAAASHGSGLCFIAIDVARFLPPEEFQRHVADLAAYVKSSAPAAGFEEVLVPGEYEHRHRKLRAASGIDLPDAVWKSLADAADRFGVPLPLAEN